MRVLAYERIVTRKLRGIGGDFLPKRLGVHTSVLANSCSAE